MEDSLVTLNYGNMNNNEQNDSLDEDSDAKQFFELPKRKIIRPPSKYLQRKVGLDKTDCLVQLFKCCKLCCTIVLPVVLAVFIVSTILCVIYLIMGISGMKNDLHMLKIRLDNSRDAETTSLSRNVKLRHTFQEKLNALEQHQTNIKKLEASLNMVNRKLNMVNDTLHVLMEDPIFNLSPQLKLLQADIGTLKTGMADTGGDIAELKGEDEKIKKELMQLQSKTGILEKHLFNLTVLISKIENLPPPTTTPKMLVVTMTPDEELPVKRKELKDQMKEFEEKQMAFCRSEGEKLSKDLLEFKNYQREEIASLVKQLDVVKNRTVMSAVVSKLTLPAGRNSTHSESPTNSSRHVPTQIPITSVNPLTSAVNRIKPGNTQTTLLKKLKSLLENAPITGQKSTSATTRTNYSPTKSVKRTERFSGADVTDAQKVKRLDLRQSSHPENEKLVTDQKNAETDLDSLTDSVMEDRLNSFSNSGLRSLMKKLKHKKEEVDDIEDGAPQNMFSNYGGAERDDDITRDPFSNV